MAIKVDTLGGLRIHKGGEEYPQLLSQKRRCALLVYLGMEGEATRDVLLNLFWPERDPEKARHSLSQTIYEIRQDCNAECLETHGEFVRANRSLLDLDAFGFQTAVEDGRYADALPMYGGAFLEGVHLADTPEFEGWTDQVRGRLRRRHRKARMEFIERLADSGKNEKAVDVAREWVELDPLEDEAQHAFIELLASVGRRSEALKQYESYLRVLAEDDLEPLDDTKELVGRIKKGEDPSPTQVPESQVYEDLSPKTPATVTESAPAPYPTPTAADLETQHPWIVDLAHAVRNSWVFRIALGYAAALFIGLQIADPFNISSLLLARLTAIAVALFPVVISVAWAMEPSVQRYRKGGPKAIKASERLWGLFSRRGIPVALVAALAFTGVGLWWPSGSGGEDPPGGPSLDSTRGYPIAILPILVADSTDLELTAFAGNLTRALIDHFTGFRALQVPPERAIWQYRDQAVPRGAVTRELRVNHVITGDVARSGETIEIRLQMSDSTSTLWRDVFPYQGGEEAWDRTAIRDVVPELTEEMRTVLGRDIEAREVRLGTDVVEAWRLVQRGREWSSQVVDLISGRDFEDVFWAIDQADSLFREASVLDDSWPEPYTRRAHLAELSVGAGFRAQLLGAPGGMAATERTEKLDEGIAHANRALELYPGNPKALEQRGALYFFRRAVGRITDPVERMELEDRAIRDFRQALAEDPNLTRARAELSVILYGRGDYGEARTRAREAYEQNAFMENMEEILNTWALSSFEVEDESEALRRCREGLNRFPNVLEMFVSCELTVLAFGTPSRTDGYPPGQHWSQSLHGDADRRRAGPGRPGRQRSGGDDACSARPADGARAPQRGWSTDTSRRERGRGRGAERVSRPDQRGESSNPLQNPKARSATKRPGVSGSPYLPPLRCGGSRSSQEWRGAGTTALLDTEPPHGRLEADSVARVGGDGLGRHLQALDGPLRLIPGLVTLGFDDRLSLPLLVLDLDLLVVNRLLMEQNRAH